MAGIDHLMINCNNYERAIRFYSWLMPKLGYSGTMSFDKPNRVTGFFGSGSGLWVQEADADVRGESFSKGRVGLREVAFAADSRAQVDQLAREIEAHGGRILDPPREYPIYAPGYYSVFFTDTDGLKLELVHVGRD
jgi:glyoxylase I family protein